MIRRYRKTIFMAVISGMAASLLVVSMWFFSGVDAATFDSNLIPSSTATYKLGASGQVWTSVNDIIYFSGSNVGIGVSSPGQTLEVNGGIRINTTTSKPTCASAQRGTFWVTQGGAGVADSAQVCAKDSSDVYSWRSIATIP